MLAPCWHMAEFAGRGSGCGQHISAECFSTKKPFILALTFLLTWPSPPLLDISHCAITHMGFSDTPESTEIVHENRNESRHCSADLSQLGPGSVQSSLGSVRREKGCDCWRVPALLHLPSAA